MTAAAAVNLRRITAILALIFLPNAAEGGKPKPSFAERLEAQSIVFADQPMKPLTTDQLVGYEIVRDLELERIAHSTLDKLMRAHPSRVPEQLPFFLIKGASYNCSTLPTGGAILCTDRAIRLATEAGARGENQLAFLLAHELAHVTIASHRQRFEKSQTLKSTWSQMGSVAAVASLMALSHYTKTGNTVTMTTTATANSVFWVALQGGVNMGEIADGLVAPSWAKADEDEADAFALILMQRAAYDPVQAGQFLATLDRELRQLKMHDTLFGAMMREGASGAATQAMLGKGNVWTIVGGTVTGMLSGWAKDGATAHYHRAPLKRGVICATQVGLMTPKPTEGSTSALFAVGEDAPALQVAVAAPAKPERRGAVRGKRPPTPPAAPPLSEWEAYLARDSILDELAIADRVRELIAANKPAAAAALCPRQPPRTAQLALACGIAFSGAGDTTRALPMLDHALTEANPAADTYRRVAQAQANLKHTDLALQTIAKGEQRYPRGELYPDEILIRGGSGDLAGAQKTAETCGKQAEKPYPDLCAKTLASVKSAAAQPEKSARSAISGSDWIGNVSSVSANGA